MLGLSVMNVCLTRRQPECSRTTFVYALLMLLVAVSVQSVAQASATSTDDTLQQAVSAAEPAAWRVPLLVVNREHDAPASLHSRGQGRASTEFPGVESETDGDPVDSDAPRVLQLVLACTAIEVSTGQTPRGMPDTYVAKYAASPALARAPPALRSLAG